MGQRGGIACVSFICFHSFAEVAACLQFSKGFEKKNVPSGKGYIRLTPQPNVT